MAVLITGGAGYIGSHTAVELMQAGEDVVIVDNFFNSKPEVLKNIEKITGKAPRFYEVDLLDKKKLEVVFSENKIESVIHFAGYKAVGESVQKPLMYYHNNITGTLILCEVMEAFDCRRLVFSSSATVYGMDNPIPYKEDMPIAQAPSPYGNTKIMLETVFQDICRSSDKWSVALLRYFNPIGAHTSGLIGENPNGIPNNLLPYIAKVAAGQLEVLSVFGDDYDTPDGTCIRDYIHVMDLAQGHKAALDFLRTKEGAHIFNLGSGSGSSVLEVLASFEKACGKPVAYKMAPRREGDIAVVYADASLAKKELHWQTKRTLDEMCMSAWNFTKNNIQ